MCASDEAVGPVDIIVIGYPKGAPLTGRAGDAVVDLVERGVIRVLDAVFVMKDEDGNFSGLAARDLTQDQVGDFIVFEGASSGILGDEDMAAVADTLEPGEAAAVIMFENTWAAPFVAAVREAGGELIAAKRIPAAELMDALDGLED